MILTPEQFRSLAQEDVALEDDALLLMLAANEEAINAYAGPLVETTERFWGVVPLTVNLRGEPQSLTSIDVIYNGVSYELDVDVDVWTQDNKLHLAMEPGCWGNTRGTWGERLTVTYLPKNVDSATRMMVCMQLTMLDLQWSPGLNAASAGPWQETYTRDQLAARERILERLRPRQVFA